MEIVECEHDFVHVAMPLFGLSARFLAVSHGFMLVWEGGINIVGAGVVNQNKGFVVGVEQAIAKVAVSLLEGVQAV